MEMIMTVLTFLLGLLFRLAVPVAVTIGLVDILRKLDARWQKEAQVEYSPVKKPECWRIKDCCAAQRQTCPAFTASLPCWQVFRFPNGYLREECISCKVFLDAPIPKVNIAPRRV